MWITLRFCSRVRRAAGTLGDPPPLNAECHKSCCRLIAHRKGINLFCDVGSIAVRRVLADGIYGMGKELAENLEMGGYYMYLSAG